MQGGAALQEKKAQEAAKKRVHPCPFERFSSHRQDQLVRDWLGKGATTLDARRLGEEDCDTYDDYLLLQFAILEATPILDARRERERKNKAKHDEVAQPRKRPLGKGGD